MEAMLYLALMAGFFMLALAGVGALIDWAFPLTLSDEPEEYEARQVQRDSFKDAA